MGRGGQVFIFNPTIGGSNPWATLALNTIRAVGMFFWRGDFIARHNLPYRPVFDPITGVFFLAGVAIALVRAKRKAACALALTWMSAMLLPTILAEDTPHFLRAVGVLPIITVFPAMALSEIFDLRFQTANGLGTPRHILRAALIFTVLASSLAFTAHDYFVRYAHDETARYWFDDAGAQLAAEINRFTGIGWTGYEWIAPNKSPEPGRRVFLDQSLWSGDAFANTRFLVPHLPMLTLIKTDSDLPAPNAGPTLLLLWPYEDWRRALTLLPLHSAIEFREGALSKGDRDPEPIMTYLAVQAEPYTSPPQPLAQFQNGIQLIGAEICGAHIRLMWHTPQTLNTDYAVFVHALRDGTRVAQHDGDPAGGYYPTSQWRPGDIVADEHVLVGTWDALRDRVIVGLYRRDTGERLPVVDAAGNIIGDSVRVTR